MGNAPAKRRIRTIRSAVSTVMPHPPIRLQRSGTLLGFDLFDRHLVLDAGDAADVVDQLRDLSAAPPPALPAFDSGSVVYGQSVRNGTGPGYGVLPYREGTIIGEEGDSARRVEVESAAAPECIGRVRPGGRVLPAARPNPRLKTGGLSRWPRCVLCGRGSPEARPSSDKSSTLNRTALGGRASPRAVWPQVAHDSDRRHLGRRRGSGARFRRRPSIRQREPESTSLADFAFHPYLAAVRIDGQLAEGQSKTGREHLPLSLGLHLP